MPGMRYGRCYGSRYSLRLELTANPYGAVASLLPPTTNRSVRPKNARYPCTEDRYPSVEACSV
eukprot:1928988-Rhodomonas_salina.3